MKFPDKYWVLDFETNGLPKGDDTSSVDITEVGCLKYEKDEDDQILLTKEIHGLCRPVDAAGQTIPIPEKITKITGIDDDLLKNEEPPIVVFEKIMRPVVDSSLPIVGHNIVGFDMLFLDKYCDALGWQRVDKSRYIDTAALFKAYRKAHQAQQRLPSIPNVGLFNWSKGILAKSYKEDAILFNLDAAVGYLGVSQFGVSFERHRALFDIVLTQRVLEKIREEFLDVEAQK